LKILSLIIAIGYLHLTVFWSKDLINWHYPLAYLCGVLSMSLFFNVLHDANHFECFAAPYNHLNEVMSRIVGANSFVKHEMIMTHHTFRHHAYTGNPTLDPERQWLIKQAIKKLFKNKLHAKIFFVVIFGIFPGQWPLTAFVYTKWYLSDKLMNNPNQKLPPKIVFTWYELMIYGYNIINILHLIYKGRFLIIYLFFLGLSNLASIGFIPAHDVYQVVQNGDIDPNKDYGEIQCYNNSNFHNNVWFNFMYSLMGGINYHNEHHLFPTLSHSHYPRIAPIVKKTCEEFKI